MAISTGLKNSLNKIRELSSEIYHQYIPILEDDSDIAKLAEPVLTVPEVYNEFCNALINRIVYTKVNAKLFKNPYQALQEQDMPLGYAGQEIYINPAAGRTYDVNDFAGILAKYDADVKVQYLTKNLDRQYPVTIIRTKLKEAFVSWDALDRFISGITNSLYNGMYIDEFRMTKSLVSSAYKANNVKIETISAVSSEATAKAFIEKARNLYLNFQTPSSEYNAWHQVGGAGRPITTWTDPEDIVIMLRNDVRSYVDVNVLASAFNLSKSDFLAANIYPVDNFDVYNPETGVKIFDGSKIIGFIGDRRWFNIKKIDQFMEDQRNANNRSMQLYLNNIMMFEYSLFANGVIFATEAPEVKVKTIDFGTATVEIDQGDHEGLDVTITPAQATSTITYTCTAAPVGGNTSDLVITTSDNGRHVDIAAKADADAGDYTVTASAESGTVTDTLTVTVKAVA